MNNQSDPLTNAIVTIQDRRKSGITLKMDKETTREFISPDQLYEAVYENAFHPILICGAQGKVIKYNEKFLTLFGYSFEEMKKLRSSDFFKTDDASFINFIERRNEKGIAKEEIRGIKKSGEIFPCRISSVFYESDGGQKRCMNTIVNISEHISARWNIGG